MTLWINNFTHAYPSHTTKYVSGTDKGNETLEKKALCVQLLLERNEVIGDKKMQNRRDYSELERTILFII